MLMSKMSKVVFYEKKRIESVFYSVPTLPCLKYKTYFILNIVINNVFIPNVKYSLHRLVRLVNLLLYPIGEDL
jgi:hypothetical protein